MVALLGRGGGAAENFFQIRKEAMGHKNYTASRFLVDFIDTAVDKLTVTKHNAARDDIIMLIGNVSDHK